MKILEKPRDEAGTVVTEITPLPTNKEEPKIVRVPLPPHIRKQMPKTARTFADRTFLEVLFPNLPIAKPKKRR